MSSFLFIIAAMGALWAFGLLYSRWIARRIGEDPSRITPAVSKNDGRDYVPTPTPVVFAHHYASIAGAGPIIGPVIAIIFGWGPALLWVLLGGIFIGAVHDYMATYMATREGGQSIATIARRLLGRGVFLALVFFLIMALVLVCATFLNASATALTSMLPLTRLQMPEDQTLFRIVVEDGERKAVIGGIASMSVIVITAVAPLLGWMYLKKKVAVWKCSLLALCICAVSIVIGLFFPVTLSPDVWKGLLAAYVLIAAGVPVWIFLQSRDFINVHLLYIGLTLLVVTLFVAALRAPAPAEPIPAFNIAKGTEAKGPLWPMLFILIACGAVSGFHSLCAGGTTCKQITSEPAARRIGYGGMLLESTLALCVIGVLVLGASQLNYLKDVHPALCGMSAKPNVILGFAAAMGNLGNLAYGIPVVIGALAGMVLLEGFLVTTLDTAIRLTRYLIEEIWRTLFERRSVPWLLTHYWFNSGLAVGLTLLFAFSGGIMSLWPLFATSNQLLASIVLSIAALWLLKQGRRSWFVAIPAALMLVTTCASLILQLQKFLSGPKVNVTLLVADLVLMAIVIYLFTAGIAAAVRSLSKSRQGETP